MLAILPAAGSARRMGRPKLLLPYAGETLLGRLVKTLRAAGVARLLLVVAPDDDQLSAWAVGRELAVVRNPEPERGMLSSITAALAALGGADRLADELGRSRQPLLITPADLPALETETVVRLRAALDTGPNRLLLPTYRGRRGHPLLIAAERVRDIASLDPDVGLRQLLDRFSDEVGEVTVEDPGVVFDVDTTAQYRALLAGELG